MTTNEKLHQNTDATVYINNVFGKNINARIGPVFDGNMRAIFAQGGKGGSFFKIGRVNIDTGEVEKMGEENYLDTLKVLKALAL